MASCFCSSGKDEAYKIGRNAVENTELVLRSSDMDVWFHVNGLPSAHLVYYNPDGLDLIYLRKKGVIYRMALNLKKSSKYHKCNSIEVIYDYIKNIIPLTKPGLVQCNPTGSMIINV
jgi:predicted ribosome quality control (RQC) complex YloA/Tae2 family protein